MANASKREAAPKRGEKSEEYQRFEKFVKELVAVPKSELDRREAEYPRKKVAEKKRKFA
jgi:hypothetical protein